MIKIAVIPDTQVTPESNTDHIEAYGEYVAKHKPEVIVHIGDHFDMHSLSQYDKGKLASHNAYYQGDIDSGIEALKRFDKPINAMNSTFTRWKKRKYQPRKVFTLGNHEYRLSRHVESNPELKGKLSYDDFKLVENGWEVHNFLEIVNIEGIRFSHYMVNPDSAKGMPFSSGVDLMLQKLGFSFFQGHKQGLYTASPRFSSDGTVTRGMILGSFYQEDQHYISPQANKHYRGAVMLTEVDGTGWFSPHELSIDYLLNRM